MGCARLAVGCGLIQVHRVMRVAPSAGLVRDNDDDATLGRERGCDAHAWVGEFSLPTPCPIRFVHPFPNAKDRDNRSRARFSWRLVGH